jgi:hypothetical protein
VYWEAIQQWLASTRLLRRLAETLFRGRARRHLAALDHQDIARCQYRTLRGLVHQAHATRFGREHDFWRIRTPADFRRLVPLRSRAEFWRDYWQPAFPYLSGVTWPAPIPSLIAQPARMPPYLPAPPALWINHRRAALTALSFIVSARPAARLFSGRILLVSDGPALTLPAPGVHSGSVEWLGVYDLPPRLRPYTFPPPVGEGPDESADGRLRRLVQSAVGRPVTCIAGDAGVLARFFDLCRLETGWRKVADVWPGLTAILYQRQPGAPGAEQLLAEVGPVTRREPILLLEACFRPEGALAVEDPRHGCLRLLADHGVYFEFVPLDEVGKPRPSRLGVTDVEPGCPYALALSSPAGVWACLADLSVSFLRRDPPLLRILEAPPHALASPHGLTTRTAERLSPPPQLHPRNGDNQGERSERPDRIPLSGHADRE